MTGILIGLLLAGLYIGGSNTGPSTSVEVAVARGHARVLACILVLASIGGLVDAFV